jgi:hypothetical protein
MYEYAVLGKGSYFGDISILLNQPNLYSYAFNDFQPVSLQLLTISSAEFLQICDDYKFSKDVMTLKAQKRAEKFNNYKTLKLLKYMKTL